MVGGPVERVGGPRAEQFQPGRGDDAGRRRLCGGGAAGVGQADVGAHPAAGVQGLVDGHAARRGLQRDVAAAVEAAEAVDGADGELLPVLEADRASVARQGGDLVARI